MATPTDSAIHPKNKPIARWLQVVGLEDSKHPWLLEEPLDEFEGEGELLMFVGTGVGEGVGVGVLLLLVELVGVGEGLVLFVLEEELEVVLLEGRVTLLAGAVAFAVELLTGTEVVLEVDVTLVPLLEGRVLLVPVLEGRVLLLEGVVALVPGSPVELLGVVAFEAVVLAGEVVFVVVFEEVVVVTLEVELVPGTVPFDTAASVPLTSTVALEVTLAGVVVPFRGVVEFVAVELVVVVLEEADTPEQPIRTKHTRKKESVHRIVTLVWKLECFVFCYSYNVRVKCVLPLTGVYVWCSPSHPT